LSVPQNLMNITQIWLSTAEKDSRPELSESIKDSMASVADSFAEVYPDCDYKFYDNEAAENFLRTKYEPKVFDAYKALRPLCYRCDLLRYCILFKKGGWYVDCGVTWIRPVKLPDHVELLAFRDIGRYTRNSWSCQGAVIYAKPGHPALARAIENVLDNVENNYYGMTPLCPTGPSLWGRSIAETAVNNHQGLFFGDCTELTPLYPDKNKCFILPDGTLVAESKRANGGDLTALGAKDTNNYNEFWHSRQVYV